MTVAIHKVEYYNITVRDQPGEAYRLLSTLHGLGLELHAFTAIPVGPNSTQLTVFPGDRERFAVESGRIGMALDGPYEAFLVQGDDELGALIPIHELLFRANVNVYASTGVADGRGGFGYVIYVKAADFERAAGVLEL